MFSLISDTGDSEEKIQVLPKGVEPMTFWLLVEAKVMALTPVGRTQIFSSESPVSLIEENISPHKNFFKVCGKV